MNGTRLPKVSVGVMVIKGEKVLLGKRRSGSHDGMYAFPGGHLEWLEDFADCAKRELVEECGPQFKITEPEFFNVYNILDTEKDKHYLAVVMKANWQAGEPIIAEPDKCYEWGWFSFDQLPSNVFSGNKQAIADLNNFS